MSDIPFDETRMHGLQSGMENLGLNKPYDDSDDERPLSLQGPSRSVRPERFIKPPLQPPQGSVPADMQTVQQMYMAFTDKVYMEGFIRMKNELTVDGTPCEDQWSAWYAELCGPCLLLWDAQTEEPITPQYINISDSQAQLEGNVWSLNSVGANRFLIESQQNPQWVRAIRLACFEASRIHEIYTRKFITSRFADLLAKPMVKMEGFLQVKFSGSTDWQQYWTVVSDRRDEKKLFGKKSVPSRGQLMFYESKKAKQPLMTMVNVVQAHTIYPDAPHLVEMATVLKVEGSLHSGEQQTTSSALLMAPSTKELVQWIVGTFDAFKLYGRPSKLLDDPANISALNFGEGPRLFLDPFEVQHINVQDESLIDNKATFAGILLNKITHPLPQAPGPAGLMQPGPPPQMQPIGQMQPRYPAPRGSMLPPGPANPSRASVMPPVDKKGKVIYASDESENDDDDEDDDDDDDSDNDSVFNQKQLPKSPNTPNPTRPLSKSTRGSAEDDRSASKLTLPQISSDNEDFAQSILGEDKNKHAEAMKSDSALSQAESDHDRKNEQAAPSVEVRRPRPKMSRPQTSVSGSDSEEEEEEEEDPDASDSDDERPINDGRYPPMMNGYPQQHQPMDGQMDPRMMYGDMYYGEGDPRLQAYYGDYIMTDDGPIIPQLGDRFATQNSLLDTFRPDHPSARDQEGWARATGQPLIQLPNKQAAPRAGLVGMISQLEHDKKDKEANRGRLLEMEKERLMERERERYLMDQRQQMMQKQQQMQQQSMMASTSQHNLGGGGSGGGGSGGGVPGGNSSSLGLNVPPPQMMDPRMSMMSNMGMMPMMDPRMSMMPNMGMMPMMDPRMAMMSNMGMMPMMDPRMSMDPRMAMMPNMGMMPMMMDPRMSMMQNPGMWNNGGRLSPNPPGNDEDDDVPLGNNKMDGSHSPTPARKARQ
ncbi:hypothetical protein DFQ28_001679 [Apophysomyces sp. BC1034]|nr:hypothetical protein DFQ30_002092 [Apophysomyces sp. BC1015]KAG0179554.1 hypothetical protein DFQ29_001934 [Apophysomyces sp. BC1021]KAG0190711.1 hypothetical protein DFQ28_001679 [Apophysomyces sp. BC1034]